MTERRPGLENDVKVESSIGLYDLFGGGNTSKRLFNALDSRNKHGEFDGVNVGTAENPLEASYAIGILKRVGNGELDPDRRNSNPYRNVTPEMESAIWKTVMRVPNLIPEEMQPQIEVRLSQLNESIGSPVAETSNTTLNLSDIQNTVVEAFGSVKSKIENVTASFKDGLEESKLKNLRHSESDDYVELLKNQFTKADVSIDPGMGHPDETVVQAAIVEKRRFVNVALNYNAPKLKSEATSVKVGNHELDNSVVHIRNVKDPLSESGKIRSFAENLKLVSLREARLQAEIDATPAAYQTDVKNEVSAEMALMKYLRYSLIDGKVPAAQAGKNFSLADLDKFAESIISARKLKLKLTSGSVSLAIALTACGAVVPTIPAENPTSVVATAVEQGMETQRAIETASANSFTFDQAKTSMDSWVGVQVNLTKTGEAKVENFAGILTVDNVNNIPLVMSSMDGNGNVDPLTVWGTAVVRTTDTDTNQTSAMHMLLKHDKFAKKTTAFGLDLADETEDTRTFNVLEMVDGEVIATNKQVFVNLAGEGGTIKIVNNDTGAETIFIEPVSGSGGETPPTQVPEKFIGQFASFNLDQTDTQIGTATPDVLPSATSLPEMPAGGKETTVHNNEHYVLNAEGNPTHILKDSKWEPFVKPVVSIIDADYFEHKLADVSSVDVNKFDDSQVVKLTDNEGKDIPLGYLFEKRPFPDNPSFTHLFISGIARGCINVGDGYRGLVFDISSKWETQVLVIPLEPLTQTSTFTNVWPIPQSGNLSQTVDTSAITGLEKVFTSEEMKSVMRADRISISYGKSTEAVCSPKAVGRQMVIGLQVPYHSEMSARNQFDQNSIEMREKMRKGESLKGFGPGNFPDMMPSFMFIPEDLMK